MKDALRVVLATGNQGKVLEFDRLLRPMMVVEAVPGCVTMPEETGSTFAANARIKAEAVAAQLGGEIAVLADDSGLEVAALGGRPGVTSARFAGEGATDQQNVDKLLQLMEGADDRGARFICRLCLLLPSSGFTEQKPLLIEVEGRLSGRITREPLGDRGFGYDPVFQPDCLTETLAQARPEDKDRVSHRGAACRVLLDRVGDLCAGSGRAG